MISRFLKQVFPSAIVTRLCLSLSLVSPLILANEDQHPEPGTQTQSITEKLKLELIEGGLSSEAIYRLFLDQRRPHKLQELHSALLWLKSHKVNGKNFAKPIQQIAALSTQLSVSHLEALRELLDGTGEPSRTRAVIEFDPKVLTIPVPVIEQKLRLLFASSLLSESHTLSAQVAQSKWNEFLLRIGENPLIIRSVFLTAQSLQNRLDWINNHGMNPLEFILSAKDAFFVFEVQFHGRYSDAFEELTTHWGFAPADIEKDAKLLLADVVSLKKFRTLIELISSHSQEKNISLKNLRVQRLQDFVKYKATAVGYLEHLHSRGLFEHPSVKHLSQLNVLKMGQAELDSLASLGNDMIFMTLGAYLGELATKPRPRSPKTPPTESIYFPICSRALN